MKDSKRISNSLSDQCLVSYQRATYFLLCSGEPPGLSLFRRGKIDYVFKLEGCIDGMILFCAQDTDKNCACRAIGIFYIDRLKGCDCGSFPFKVATRRAMPRAFPGFALWQFDMLTLISPLPRHAPAYQTIRHEPSKGQAGNKPNYRPDIAVSLAHRFQQMFSAPGSIVGD